MKFLSAAALACVVIVAAGAVRPAEAETVRQLVYRVMHTTYGDIGTYSNTVAAAGDTTTVKTSVHFKVSVLGMVMHRQDAERTERWKGNRLVYFHGVTDKNGKVTEINGEARGDDFVITSPFGTIKAPASIRPANPWSLNSLQTNAMMRVDTGKVEAVRVGGGHETMVQIGGIAIPTREYQIGGTQHFKVWMDRHDVPVKFAVDEEGGQVVFSLQR